MAEEPHFSPDATTNNKRKYDDADQPRSATRRPTGFSAPIIPPPSSDQSRDAPPPASYNAAPPPPDEIQIAKQRAQEIAARLSAAAAGAGAGVGGLDVKRARVDNGSGFDGDKGFGSGALDVKAQYASAIPPSYGSHGSSKKIDIPNERVGVIIGRSGDTIKYLQLQSGAKIQVTRDTEADPHSVTRPVELMGTPEQIAKAEQLITEVLAEAEQGGSGVVSRRLTGQAGSDQFVMKIPDNKVGLVIGKGGETIKSMQANSGARIQVIPLRKPPGDMSTERTVQIDGTSEQIEAAKQLVNEVISGENRLRNPTMGGGYSQQGYQARPPTSWGPGAPQMQQPGYGYAQPGSYPGPSPQYNMGHPPYPGYSQPTSGGYSANWDQSTAPPTQQASQGSGYDYYNQQTPAQQQTPGGSAQAGDNTGYNYGQPPSSGYSQSGQGYAQDGYGGYQAPPPNSGYGQPPHYEQHQTYNSATGYGNATNPSQEVQASTYGAQGDSSQAPPPVQPPAGQGYSATQQPSPNTASYPQGYGAPSTTQAGYGNVPSAQSGYGPGYGMPQTQKSAYGQQPQQSPSSGGGYAQPSVQPGYPHSQPPASAYAQADSGAQHAPPSSYAAAQPGYGQPPYGSAPAAQVGYGQAPPSYGSYGGGYSQTPPVYAADANAGGSTPAAQANQQGGVAKASPQS